MKYDPTDPVAREKKRLENVIINAKYTDRRNSVYNPSRSTIDGIRATRSAHIKAGRITPTEDETEIKANGHTNTVRVASLDPADHVRYEGLDVSLNKTKARKKTGKSRVQANREECWIYGLCLDPERDEYKNGWSQKVMNDYIQYYRYRLHGRHDNVLDLPFLLIYKCTENGRDVEEFVFTEMRRLGYPGSRREDSIWYDDESFVAAMKAVCSKIKGLTLVYDHLAGGIVKTNPLTVEANSAILEAS